LQQNEEINWDKYWNPKLFVENIYNEAKENVYYTVLFDEAGRATISEKRRVSGSFFEYMELNQFPFDTQVLYPVWKYYIVTGFNHFLPADLINLPHK